MTNQRQPMPPVGLPKPQRPATAEARSDFGLGESTNEVIQAAKAGDLEAFRALVEATQDRVRRVVQATLRCDHAAVEDLAQDTFVRVWRSLPRFQGGNFIAWMHKVATSAAISEWRKRSAQKRGAPTLSIDAELLGTDSLCIEPASRERDPHEVYSQREFNRRVRACVHELPEEYRDAVVLRDLEGLSYEETADALRVPIGTARSRIHRGRCMLQQALQGFLP